MASRPTKYAHVVGNLPRYIGETPDRLALLNGLKEEILVPRDDEDYNLGAQIRAHIDDATDLIQVILGIAKRNVVAHNASNFAGAYADARSVLDAINEWKSSAQLLVDAYEGLMIDQMEEEGVTSLRLESGAGVSMYSEPYGQVVDKEKFRLWCVANGYEGSLQLWPSTMNAITKERTLAGDAPPDGVEVTAKMMVRLNKA